MSAPTTSTPTCRIHVPEVRVVHVEVRVRSTKNSGADELWQAQGILMDLLGCEPDEADPVVRADVVSVCAAQVLREERGPQKRPWNAAGA